MSARSWFSCILAVSASAAHAQYEFIRDAMPLQKDAVFLMAPDEASTAKIEDTTWSPDGRFLAIRRTSIDATTSEVESLLLGTGDQPLIKHEVAVYSSLTGKTRVVASYDPAISIDECFWLAGSNTLAIVARTVEDLKTGPVARHQLSLVSMTTGQTQTVSEDDAGDLATCNPSPSVPMVAVSRVAPVDQPLPGQQPNTEVRFIGLKGLLPRVCSIPAGGWISWRDFGKVPYFVSRGRKGKSPQQWKLNPETGSAEPVATLPALTQVTALAPAMNLTFDQTPIVSGTSRSEALVVRLRAPVGEGQMIVTTDGDEPLLAPGGTAVSYRSRGSLLVRRIAHIPLEAYNNGLKQALKRKAIDEAKQVALALLMCANDEDDKYPSNGAGWRDKVNPYLKNSAMLANFNYTFAGGPASAIENPATTILGYIAGPDGGRAVAYTDGHVKYLNP